MKVNQLFATIAIVYSSISANAQSKLLQNITTDVKNSATTKIVATADRTVNQTLDRVLDGSFFKKKAGKPNVSNVAPQPEQTAVSSHLTGSTELNVSNTDYSSIVALADLVKSSKTVTDVQRSFSNGAGIIKVNHGCKTDELLDDILKTAAGKYEVAEVSSGRITLTIKK